MEYQGNMRRIFDCCRVDDRDALNVLNFVSS